MHRGRALAETIHLTALGLWAGSLVMAGAAAAIIFPTIKKLNPQLPDYAGYTGEHWLVTAGHPASRIFFAADVLQFVCACLAIVTMGVLLFVSKIDIRRAAGMLRLLALLVALGAFGYYFLVLAPRMQLNLRGFWEAAIQANNAEAAKFKAVFDADHPVSSRLMGTIAVAVLVSFVSGLWTAVTHDRVPRPAAEPPKPSRYPEPALARGAR
jgi:hypothetical protein